MVPEPTDWFVGSRCWERIVLGDVNTLLDRPATGLALQAYLLGRVEFESALALQRRLVYDVSSGHSPCLVLCEHPPILTMGRHGSHAHLLFDESDLAGIAPRIRWVNRGGGAWLQLPGQLAIYPIFPLGERGLLVRDYLHLLQRTIIAALDDFSVHGYTREDGPDVWVAGRPVACLGIAVRNWITYYGAVLNISPNLRPYRWIRTSKNHPPMTSLERERRGPVHPSLVRQRVLEHFAEQFGFERTLLLTDHPMLERKAASHAILAAR